MPDESGDIIVTGSRIARRATDTVEPVLVLDSKAIDARGFSTLGQALSEQPAFGIADSSPVGAQSSFGPGQSFVNFFGLGSQRTLTLVNGRRFVGSNTSTIFGPTGSGGSQVDLNLIPTKLIDRVETIAVGGAPIYGSDAIAGTINVILKKSYQGIDLDAQYGISERGDAPDYRVRALAGMNFAGGRGNVTVAGEYNETKGLLYNDRSLPALGRYYDTRTTAGYPYTRELYTNRRLPSISENGIPLVGRIGYDFLGINIILPPRYQALYGPYTSAYLGAPPGTPFNIGVTGGISPTTALRFDSVRDHPLAWIWENSPALNAYRGTDWMAEPCRSCVFREEDLGGCRCQAFAFAGNAAATDPACAKSPLHAAMVATAETEAAAAAPFVFRSFSGGVPEETRKAAPVRLARD